MMAALNEIVYRLFLVNGDSGEGGRPLLARARVTVVLDRLINRAPSMDGGREGTRRALSSPFRRIVAFSPRSAFVGSAVETVATTRVVLYLYKGLVENPADRRDLASPSEALPTP